MFRKLDGPATWDNVRPGCIIEYREVGMRRTRFYRADRLTLADAATNATYRWIYGATVRKNGSPSTSREAAMPRDAAQFLPERELVAIYADTTTAHTEALAADVEINEWRRFPELVEEQLARVAAEDDERAAQVRAEGLAILESSDADAVLAARWEGFLTGDESPADDDSHAPYAYPRYDTTTGLVWYGG